jgi:hypothetical protein
MKIKNKLYRQGDVLVIPTKSIPATLKETKRYTLALGEATGHHHSILDGSAIGYATDENALAEYVEVNAPEGAPLTHQEHDTIVLPEGQYRVIGQVEYTPERLVSVRD